MAIPVDEVRLTSGNRENGLMAAAVASAAPADRPAGGSDDARADRLLSMQQVEEVRKSRPARHANDFYPVSTASGPLPSRAAPWLARALATWAV